MTKKNHTAATELPKLSPSESELKELLIFLRRFRFECEAAGLWPGVASLPPSDYTPRG
jgi:hypothetical protein